jgi:hypothetical protein
LTIDLIFILLTPSRDECFEASRVALTEDRMMSYRRLPYHTGPFWAGVGMLVSVLGSGCSSQHVADGATPSVGTAYAALSAKTKECEQAKRACKDAADCDPTQLAACEQDFHVCREQARAEEQALHEATHACRTSEEECLDAAADRDAEKACHEQHHACMEASRPPEPPCHAALKVCLDAARAADEADGVMEDSAEGDAAAEPPPPPPSADGGLMMEPPRGHGSMGPGMHHRHHRPESPREAACHDELRSCMMDEMPPPPPPRCEPPPPPPPPPRPDGGMAAPDM